MEKNTAESQNENIPEVKKETLPESSVKSSDIPVVASIPELTKRIEALEEAVFKTKDKPIQIQTVRNFNTDPGPFPRGSGMNIIR
jgi:hypothetical protein